MKIKNWKIYGLKEPINGDVRYIGYTGNDLVERLKQHLEEVKYKKYKTHKINWIKHLLNKGQLPIIELIEDDIPIEYINKAEIHYIKGFREAGAKLTNETDGGDGMKNPSEEVKQKISRSLTGKKHSNKTKIKMSKSHSGKPFRHRKTHVTSQKTKDKISNANKGRVLSQTTKDKISRQNKGKILSAEVRAKISKANKGKQMPWLIGNKYASGRRSKLTRQKISDIQLGTIWIYDELGKHKKIKDNELQKWINMGWKTGRIFRSDVATNRGKKWINRLDESKIIKMKDIQNYINDGWKLGKLKNSGNYIHIDTDLLISKIKENNTIQEIADKLEVNRLTIHNKIKQSFNMTFKELKKSLI